MSYKIDAIEGIGPAYREKFVNAGVRTVESLLKKGCTKKGRKALSLSTGFEEKRILEWVNNADLFRVKGVSSQYAELLKASGVDTVKELRNRNAENLCTKMNEINGEQNLVRQTPSLSQTERFVEGASALEPMVTY